MFKFGISMLNRMTFLKKFLLIGIILLLPSVSVFFPYLQTLNNNTDAASLKIAGLSYNENIHAVRNNLMEHRALSSTLLSGDEASRELLLNKKAEITTSLNAGVEINRSTDKRLNHAAYWSEFEERIDDVHQKVLNKGITSVESVRIHSDIVNDLIAFGKVIADASGLVLDDDLARINVVDSIFTALPTLSNSLGLIRANGSRIAFQGELLAGDEQIISQLLSSTRQSRVQLESNLQTIERANTDFQTDVNKWRESLNQVELFLSDNVEANLLHSTNISIPSEDFRNKTTQIINEHTGSISEEMASLIDEMADEQLHQIKQTKLLLFSGFTLILLIAFYFFQSFYASIKQTVFYLEKSSQTMAAGDFTIDIDVRTKDEMNLIGLSLQEMKQSVKGIISDTKLAVNQVANSTVQLASGSEDTDRAAEIVAITISEVADGAVEQSEQAHHIFIQVNEIHGLIQTGLTRVEETITMAEQATTRAIEGEKATDAAVEQGKAVTETVSNTVTSINSLHARSNEIGQIIDVMSSIAAQTNLLALNASIEAARAGEHGRGFGVVAEEVRNLAEQSNEASQRVAKLVNFIQTETTDAVENMERNVHAIEKQAALILTGKSALQTIVSHTNSTSEYVNEIRRLLEGISQQADELNASAVKITKITETSASSAEEVAAAAEETASTVREMTDHIHDLQETAEKLTATTTRFKI